MQGRDEFPSTGVDAFIRATSRRAARYPLTPEGTRAFLLVFARQTAGIHLPDVVRPWRFLRQLVDEPPETWGTEGFRHSLIDDTNPARHYAAFVFVGYWLPLALGVPLLWLWELAGAARYGYWSVPDVRSGYVGLWHGRLLHRYGHGILPALMARDLVEQGGWGRLSASGRRALARARRRGRPSVEKDGG